MKRREGGEIVQVQGGHILRSTGRKDRHSKVYTSKGPRDRRVRLAAHTAIQFYDVQDRLGYDRPSKAVDWLIKKAKDAIDKLAELPPWNPTDVCNAIQPRVEPNLGSDEIELGQNSESYTNSRYEFQLQRQLDENPSGDSGYIPGPADPESMGDTMRSFFPTSSGTSLMMNLHNFPHDILSRPEPPVQTDQDLGLSLHTLQQEQNLNDRPSSNQVLLPGSGPLTFDAAANFSKMINWSGGGNGESKVGFVFNSQSLQQQQHPFLFQGSAFSQRESLQSNYSHLLHAWDHERQFASADHQNSQGTVHLSSMPGFHFTSAFQVPARIQGEDEHGMISQKPSSASPNSHH